MARLEPFLNLEVRDHWGISSVGRCYKWTEKFVQLSAADGNSEGAGLGLHGLSAPLLVDSAYSTVFR